MHFDKFSFGALRIGGSTYEQDVVIDCGEIRKRKKAPSRKFSALGLSWNSPLSLRAERRRWAKVQTTTRPAARCCRNRLPDDPQKIPPWVPFTSVMDQSQNVLLQIGILAFCGNRSGFFAMDV
jgi:hypothetical protein